MSADNLKPGLKPSLGKRLTRFLLRCLVWSAANTVSVLPMRWVQRLGDLFGRLAAVVVRERCEVARRNMAEVLQPPPDEGECRRLVVRCCQELTKSMLELFRLARMRPDQIMALVDITGEQHLRAAAGRGRGVIVVTAHFGNWELLGAVITLLGHRLSVIARDSSDAPTARLINQARRALGMEVLSRDDLKEMMRVLQRGEVLGILCDQHQAQGGEILQFLGRPAATAMGPALLALRTGAAIVPAFALRLPSGRFKVYFYPPIDVPRAERTDAARRIMQRVNDIIGEEISRHPDQWLWLHRRWREEILMTYGQQDAG